MHQVAVAFSLFHWNAPGQMGLVHLASQCVQFGFFRVREGFLSAKLPQPFIAFDGKQVGGVLHAHHGAQDFVGGPADDVLGVGGGGYGAVFVAVQQVDLAGLQSGDDERRVGGGEYLEAGEVF